MRAGRTWRTRKVPALCVSLAAVMAIGASATTTPAHTTSAAPGSSCANPEVMTEAMPPAGGILDSSPANHLDLVSLPGSGPRTLQWEAHPGYLICATSIQLADGSIATPTYAFPSYPTPLPLGGQYNEATGSAISGITVKIAKTPAPVGSSCNSPEESTLLGNNPHRSPKSHVSIAVVEDSPTRLQLKLKPHRANLLLCPKADIFLSLTSPTGFPAQRRVFPVSVKPHGGLSSAVTVPAGSYRPTYEPSLVEAVVYARVVK
jgi:hypothetical protein